MNHISKIVKSTALLGALAFVSAVSSQAGTLTLWDSWGGGNGLGGGEYTITGDAYIATLASSYSASTRVGAGFESFCLEENVGIYSGTPYNYSISSKAQTQNDALSLGTAYLYSQFANGVLAGYNYTNLTQRALDADDLQIAIWWLENEGSWVYNASNKFELAVFTKFGSVVGARADNNGLYGAAVLNITDSNGADKQDQLVRVPDGGLTVALFGFAVLGLALIRRKIAA